MFYLKSLTFEVKFALALFVLSIVGIAVTYSVTPIRISRRYLRTNCSRNYLSYKVYYPNKVVIYNSCKFANGREDYTAIIFQNTRVIELYMNTARAQDLDYRKFDYLVNKL